MARLAEALAATRLGAHRADAVALLQPLLEAVRPGDVVMVKGSLGMAMAPMVAALRGLAADDRARRAGGRDAL